jgi:hypothetical protein
VRARDVATKDATPRSEVRDPYWRIRLRRYCTEYPEQPATLAEGEDDE